MVTCLVTGNLEPIGWGKMEALGLIDTFTSTWRWSAVQRIHCTQHRALVALAVTTALVTRRSLGGTGHSLCALPRKRRLRLVYA